MEKAFFARIFALPQWQRRGEKRRRRGLERKGGRGGEGALSRWYTSEIPMLFSLLPRFTFPGITDNASYCSWMLFLRSIRIQLRNFIFLKRFRLFTHAHPFLPTLSSISLSCFEARRCQSFRFKTPIIDLFSKVGFLRPSWRDVWSVCIRWCWTRVR